MSVPDTRPVAPDDELIRIVERAASLGIPAWRVTTALGLAPAPVSLQPQGPRDGAS